MFKKMCSCKLAALNSKSNNDVNLAVEIARHAALYFSHKIYGLVHSN